MSRRKLLAYLNSFEMFEWKGDDGIEAVTDFKNLHQLDGYMGMIDVYLWPYVT